ncbi:MAG: DUF4838 domain-containing protein [Ferruginibacter sp.]
MKKIFLNLFFIFFLQHVQSQTSIPIYYCPVNMPASMQSNYYGLFDTRLLATDLAGLLKQATGQTFIPTIYDPAATSGIFLLLDNNTVIGNEAGIVDADGKNVVRITAHYTTGISYAMYSWLEELGFRFYLPGDDWIIVPSLKNIFAEKIDKKIFKPYFHVRMFGASMPGIKGLDDSLQNNKAWQQWQIRNRMGCDYIKIGGHIGEAFNFQHRKEIESDTSILAPVNGKRQYSAAGKLDPTYKKGIALFSDWIVEEFKKEQSTFPSFLPFKKYFSADAGDGLNYCHTAECERQFKSVSDQVFSIVNETAKKIKLADPAAGVSTLAYAERADTPGIHLEPNVHTMVVASGYQHVTTPAELIKSWAKKSNNISVYDYLNVGFKLNDKPYFNLYRYFNNLEFLKSLNIEGLTIETSYSKFATGIQQYFILKYLCDPYASIDNELDIFCKDNFGNAAVSIKKLFKEWYFSDVHLQTNSDYPSFYEDELGRFVQYISDAENSPGLTSAIKKRIEELKAYTTYLCKYYELFAELKSLQEYKNQPATRVQKAEAVLTYTWQLYDTKIFHNTILNDMLLILLPKDLKEKWNYRRSDHFKKIKTDVASLIKSEFEKTRNKYLPFAEPVYPITDEFLEANIKNSADSIRIVTTDEIAVPYYIYPIQFYCGSPGILKINYQADSSRTKNKIDKVTIVSVESADYKFLKTDIVYKGNSNGTLIYNIPSKGHYRLYLSQYNSTHTSYVIYPGKNIFYDNKKSIMPNCMLLQDYEKKNYCSNKWLAIYAPPVDSLHFCNFYIESVNTSRFYDATGKALTVRPGKQPFYNSVAVPKNQKDNFLFFENSSYRLPPVLKNTAPYYFFLKYPLK